MATKSFSVTHSSGKTVFFEFWDFSDLADVQLWDDTNGEWNSHGSVNEADKKVLATEVAAAGGDGTSKYVANVDLADLYSNQAPKELYVNAKDDMATDEIISSMTFMVSNGSYVGSDYEDSAISSRSSHDDPAADIAALNDPTAGEIASELLGTAVSASGQDLQTVLKTLFSMARGKIVRDGDTYTYYADDGSTELFTFTVTDGGRTTS